MAKEKKFDLTRILPLKRQAVEDNRPHIVRKGTGVILEYCSRCDAVINPITSTCPQCGPLTELRIGSIISPAAAKRR